MSNRTGILPLPGFPEAPKNGLQYARRDGGWVQSTSGATISTEPPPEPLINGQLWWDSDSGDTYVWYDDGNTKQWVQQNLSMPPVIIADSPPAGAYNGQIWWDSNSGNTYIFFDDGNSRQWVQQNGGGTDVNNDRVSVLELGVPNNGTDATASLKAAFEGGGRLYVPEGDYLIKGTGPDSGGVVAYLNHDLDIACHPKARFYTDDLDNDMVQFRVPATVGPSDGPISLVWEGGLIDQYEQRVSMVGPDRTDYPPRKQGASNTSDGLSIRLSYTDAGAVVRAGGRSVRISGLKTYGGDHWQFAGGDSGIYCGKGAGIVVIENCIHQGNRDSGIYADEVLSRFTLRNNLFQSCYFGCAVKRSSSNWVVADNHFDNLVHAFNLDQLGVGGGQEGGNFYGNTFNKVKILISASKSRGAVIQLGTATMMGNELQNGDMFPDEQASAIVLRGCTDFIVKDGRIISVNPKFSAAAYRIFQIDDDLDDSTPSLYNDFINIVSNDALITCGGDVTSPVGAGDFSYYYNCLAVNGAVPNPGGGVNSIIVRRTRAGQQNFRNPVYFADGTSAAPAIARGAQVGNGIYFAANLIGLSTNASITGTLTASGAISGASLTTTADVTVGNAAIINGVLDFKVATGATPTVNDHVRFAKVSDTSLMIRMRGSDGVVRNVTLTLA